MAIEPKPLGGIRVLDFTHVLAGPFATRLLGDLGADVVRVESSRHRDSPWRSKADEGLVRPASHLVTNRAKRSIAIDLKAPVGIDVAARLARVADVVIENFSAGVMSRLGLGPEELCASNPRLVYLSMSGYGHDGPRAKWSSMNMNLQGYSGLMMATGGEGDPPVAIANSWNDYVAGLHACFAVIHALTERVVSGRGRRIDLSQFECSVSTLGPLLLAASVNGLAPSRLANRSTEVAPQGCYPCLGDDQWCVVSVQTNDQWRSLRQVLKNDGAALDGSDLGESELDTAEGRLRHHDALDEVLEAWTRNREAAEVERILSERGIPAQRVHPISAAVEADPGNAVFQHLDDAHAPGLTVAGLPYKGGLDSISARPAPLMGEHTNDVLAQWLDLMPDEIAELESSGALV